MRGPSGLRKFKFKLVGGKRLGKLVKRVNQLR